MNKTLVLKALAEETRLKIVTLLLGHNYCVRALARQLEISEAAISQHLKILREAGFLIGEKKGYFMHYAVNRSVLRDLAHEIYLLADIERKSCSPDEYRYKSFESAECHSNKKICPDEVKDFCHGHGGDIQTCHCKRHKN